MSALARTTSAGWSGCSRRASRTSASTCSVLRPVPQMTSGPVAARPRGDRVGRRATGGVTGGRRAGRAGPVPARRRVPRPPGRSAGQRGGAPARRTARPAGCAAGPGARVGGFLDDRLLDRLDEQRGEAAGGVGRVGALLVVGEVVQRGGAHDADDNRRGAAPGPRREPCRALRRPRARRRPARPRPCRRPGSGSPRTAARRGPARRAWRRRGPRRQRRTACGGRRRGRLGDADADPHRHLDAQGRPVVVGDRPADPLMARSACSAVVSGAGRRTRRRPSGTPRRCPGSRRPAAARRPAGRHRRRGGRPRR